MAGQAPVAERFARHRGIEGWDQRRIGEATAVVVGMGALGNEVAKNLALAGVGRLILSDFDQVDTSNLSRGVLFRPSDVGEAKVAAAARALAALAPETAVEARHADLASGVGLGELADAKVVMGCLDSVHARLRLLGRCALVDAAYVDGGTYPWGGEVRIRLSAEDPCYSCSLPQAQRGETDLPWSCADERDFGPAAASIGSSALVAAWMSTAALRVLLGSPPEYRILGIDGVTGHSAPVLVELDPACPHHHPIGPDAEYQEVVNGGVGSGAVLTSQSTVADLLASLPDGAEPLAWANFPIDAPCDQCGRYAEPADRQTGSGPATTFAPCPTCGFLLRPRSTNLLRRATLTTALSQLGVAPEELLPIRLPEGGYRWLRLKR